MGYSGIEMEQSDQEGLAIIEGETHDQYLDRLYGSRYDRVLSGELSRKDFIAQSKAEHQDLENRADHDGLLETFLTIRAFTEAISTDTATGRSVSLSGSMLALDVDKLKRVNDEMGHFAGDILLIVYSQVIEACTGINDKRGRLTKGDELGVFLLGADRKTAELVAERIRTNIKETMSQVFIDLPWEQTVSIGITQAHKGEPPASLLNRADQTLYEAKQERNKVVIK